MAIELSTPQQLNDDYDIDDEGNATLRFNQNFRQVVFEILGGPALVQLARKDHTGRISWDLNELTFKAGIWVWGELYGIRFRKKFSDSPSILNICQGYFVEDAIPKIIASGSLPTPTVVSIQIPDTDDPAGAFFTVPEGQLIHPISFTYLYEASATAGNRIPDLATLDPNGNDLGDNFSFANVAANGKQGGTFAVGQNAIGPGMTAGIQQVQSPLADITLAAGMQLNFFALGSPNSAPTDELKNMFLLYEVL